VSTGDHVSDDPDMPQKLSTEAYEPNLPLGVIVGAVVGGVLAIALLSKAFLLLRRRAHRKRRAKRGFPEVRDEHEGFWALSEMSEQPKAFMLMDSPVYEVDDNNRISELSSPSPPYTRAELPGK